METYLCVALGSALGGAARYWLSGLVDQGIGETFPWGTWVVNVTGCFAIGLFAAVTAPDGRLLVASTARQFVIIGLLGGYTTFSSFALQSLQLARTGESGRAGGYVLLSMAGCLIAAWLGDACAIALNRPRGG